tara:strand:+ start:414 stop:557 length:144 start_codon:yes stop_codon:yes gene_type:complete
MDKVLIDTDENLNLFFNRKPFSEYSAEILNLWATKIPTEETIKHSLK